MEKKIEDYTYLEEWRPIPGFSFYEASNLGRIRSINKTVRHNYGGSAVKKGKILAQETTKRGYIQTALTINGKIKSIKVHTLVALAFHPNQENKPTVNHKDTDKKNNRADNLEWATQKEQVIHAIKNKCRKDWSLSNATISKIVAKTKKKVALINVTTGEIFNFNSINECAELLKVKQPTISKALSRDSLIAKKYKVYYATK